MKGFRHFGGAVSLILVNFLVVSTHTQTGFGAYGGGLAAPTATFSIAAASVPPVVLSPAGIFAASATVVSSPQISSFPSTPQAASELQSSPVGLIPSAAAAPAFSSPPTTGGTATGTCQQTDVGGGRYKVLCSGPEKEALRTEHILWLNSEGDSPYILDIEIPNYKIEELIKAGFKSGPQRDAIINVLLKKPTTSVDAQVDKQTPSVSVPKVNLQYETGSQKLTHFPVDQPYSPLVGLLLPPNDGKAAAPTQARRLLKKRKRTPTTPAPVDEVDE